MAKGSYVIDGRTCEKCGRSNWSWMERRLLAEKGRGRCLTSQAPKVVAAARERAARGEKSFVAIAAQADHIDALTARLEAAEKVVEAVREKAQWLLTACADTCADDCTCARKLLANVAAYDIVVEGS